MSCENLNIQMMRITMIAFFSSLYTNVFEHTSIYRHRHTFDPSHSISVYSRLHTYIHFMHHMIIIITFHYKRQIRMGRFDFLHNQRHATHHLHRDIVTTRRRCAYGMRFSSLLPMIIRFVQKFRAKIHDCLPAHAY